MLLRLKFTFNKRDSCKELRNVTKCVRNETTKSNLKNANEKLKNFKHSYLYIYFKKRGKLDNQVNGK